MEPTPTSPITNPGQKPTAQPVDMTTAHYAGFWVRLLALIIDSIIIGVVSSLLFGNSVATMENGSYNVNFTGWYNLIPLVYIIGFWIALSATPGKLILGLKIVDANGNKIAPLTAIVRYLGYILSSIILCIGYIMIGFDAKKQGLHDKIAKTFVVHKR